MFTLNIKETAEFSAFAELSAKDQVCFGPSPKSGERLSDKQASSRPAWINPLKDRLAYQVDAGNSSSSFRVELPLPSRDEAIRHCVSREYKAR